MDGALKSRSLVRFVVLMPLLVVGLLGIFLLSLSLGSVAVSPGELVAALLGQGDEIHRTILWELRLPRSLMALLVGSALGLSGALMQGLLRNGLADPYLLGISAGAGLAAIALFALGAFLAWIPTVAWLGATVTAALVFALARTATGISVQRLILGGVALSAFLGSLSSMLLLFADERIQVALNWLIGSLNGKGWEEVHLVSTYVICGLVAGCLLSRSLNVLQLGDEMARGLGLSLGRSRLIIGCTATLLTAAAVSSSGLIGFVGLVVPHMARFLMGTDFRFMLPVAATTGAGLLLLADSIARLGPVELPVGVVTALLGAPCFTWLLYRRSGL